MTFFQDNKSGGRWSRFPGSLAHSAVNFIALSSIGIVTHAATTAAPTIQVVDELGVNMIIGQVSNQPTPVHICGDSGLQYTISVYATEARKNVRCH